MKYIITIQVLIMTWAVGYCQLVPFQDADAIATPGFDRNAIKSKKISEITMRYFTKPDGEVISNDGMVERYFFDTTGKITESICTTKESADECDTVKCQYCYDSVGDITIKRTEMGSFFDTWYYKWNKERQVQTEAHVHETNGASVDGDFKIATQKVISTDSFAYIVYPKQVQQYAYNEDDKIFQKTITQYDDNKRFISRNSHYAVGWLYSEVDIDYDDSGRIAGYDNTGNLDGNAINQKTIIKYDSLGKIEEEGVWVNGKQQHRIEFMYENNTGLISDKLDRDNDKGLIRIICFSYETYDDKE